MSSSWECPECGATNPKGRVQCYKRACNGMPWKEKRKLIAMIGVLQNG